MLSEIPERDASGALAALYQRIKQAQGAPLVNLIWRHLATVEGALPWAWTVAEAAMPRIAAAIGPLLDATDDHVARSGLADGVRLLLAPEMAVTVVRAYERGNSWNLLAMTMLTAVRGGAPSPQGDGAGAGMAPAAGSVPPLPRYDALDKASRDCIDALAAAGPAAESGVRPSLWVHLALWPDLLRHITETCTPILAQPAFHQAHAALLGQTVELLGLPALGASPGAPVDVAIGRFRQRIPEMLLIGRVMMRAAGHAASQGAERE